MPLFEEKKENPNNTNQTDNCGFANQTNQPNNQTQNQKPSGLLTIIGQLLPLAPFAFEQFTGQKVPQMTGTVADIQANLQNIQTNLQVIVQNQQSLNQRLTALENSANNLTHQFKSLRLTHTKEQKQIEYNNENETY